MNIVEGREFIGETVELDGNDYVGCRIIGCEIVFRGEAPFSYQGTEITDCRLLLLDRARMVVAVLSAMFRDHLDDGSLLDVLRALVADRPLAS